MRTGVRLLFSEQADAGRTPEEINAGAEVYNSFFIIVVEPADFPEIASVVPAS